MCSVEFVIRGEGSVPDHAEDCRPVPYASIPINDGAGAARGQLLKIIGENGELPALGSAVSQVVQLASSASEAVRKLAYLVLSDVGLTQKILRMSNAAIYRNMSGTPVTTVTKAIFLLGFESIKTSALAMLLADGIGGRHGHSVRVELAHALAASVFARELARRSQFRDAEEVAVAALFKNISRILLAAHDHALYQEISASIASGSSEDQASLQMLGCTYAMLRDTVLQMWKIPDTIVQATAALPGAVLRPTRSRQEWLQQVTSFSDAAADLLAIPEPAARAVASQAVVARFGAALGLDPEQLDAMCARVREETRVLTANANLPMPVAAEAPAAQASDAHSGLPDGLVLDAGDTDALLIRQRHPSGKPLNARNLLLAGVQDAAEMMAGGQRSVNDLMLLVLETLYRGLGFRFATICLKDVSSGHYRARIALGDGNAARQAGFRFTGAAGRDLFHLSMENNADLLISDSGDLRIQDLLPAWYRALLPDARSFIVLPLVVQKKPLGLFYADRALPAPEGMPADETALIKTLKGQVLAALNAR
jgi:HD-like signal output (HDOD) protein